ncbi:MAG: hypothetical protein KatS3mg089_0027 [Patescibacteria group bacterium]|nr:MAG: hypothetical protein KatS3mg089_0027 [Patescibacteria group bacterium]
MKLYNSRKFIGIFIFFLIFIPLIIFLFSLYKNGTIYVLNKSKNYYLSYQETPEFLNLITNLEIFIKEVHFEGVRIKLSHLTIELVDMPQVVTYSENNSRYVINSIILLDDKRNNLVIRVYIPLVNKTLDEQRLSQIFLQEVVTKLYVISHEDTTTKILNKEIPLIMSIFRNNPEQNPFKIAIKVQK